jgi:hypothetical protein
MSIRCGNRKCDNQNTHATPADVRACFAGLYAQTSAPERPTPSQSVPERPAASPTVHPYLPVEGVLHKGKFTVRFEDGTRYTFRLRRQAKDAKFMPGKLVIGYLRGSDNDNDYTNFGHVREDGGKVELKVWSKHWGNANLVEALKVLVGDPQAASGAYAEESDNCSACSLTLTVPVEDNPYRAFGLGPKCGPKYLGEL